MRIKRLSVLLCALCLIPLLGACHGKRGAAEFAIPEDAELDGEYEITFWAKNDTNKTQTDIYQKAIDDFERIYPNIHVNLRLYTDYGRIYNDVITNIRTNTTPDVCITYPDHIATYLSGEGVVVPLDELMTDPDWGLAGERVSFDAPRPDEVIEEYLDECRIGGELYALPYMRSSEALYINKTMVEKLGYELPEDGITWDLVWEISEAAAATKGADGVYSVNGQRVLIPFIYKSTDNMMIQYLKQAGIPYSSDDGEALLFGEAGTEAFLEEIAAHTASEAFSTFKVSSYPSNFLNAGQCIFAVDSTAGATWMGSDAPLLDISPENVVRFETAVYPVPQTDPDAPVMISQGPSVCLFNKDDPKRVLASWIFMQFLLTDEVQTAYAKTEGYVPVTSKARSDSGYLDYLSCAGEDDDEHYAVKLAATELVLEHTADTFVTPVFNGSASLRDAAGYLIESTVKGVRRKQTADHAFFEKLYGDTISLYRLDENASSIEGGGDIDEPLSAVSAGLLAALALIWAGIALYLICGKLRKT